ncbi:MAG: hypothetical protein AAGA84_08030 [Pseudomonadota bacterium]
MTVRMTLVGLAFLSMAAQAQVAEASSAKRDLTACKSAIAAELGEGSARVNRVTAKSEKDGSMLWLTVRHKDATAAKSSRYRVLCTTDESTTRVDIAPGWWKKARKGQPPVALD